MGEPVDQVRVLASSLGMSPTLRAIARELGRSPRWVAEVHQLLNVFSRGGNPGLGIRHLSGGTFYLRGRRGARIFYRQADSAFYEIMGYADKSTEQRVITLLAGY